ncbi:helix-turn-helix transcriptional regulator [Enterobacter sp. Ap-916]|uniref:XRE family transcriptional regulator n=1 Tax=unclassified Enterobacter TaxID=2608935 RepID=UPI001421845E|nr:MULTISPECIES: S24 family peptidase [unclassified Enterobacter]NIF57505.1 helix-turn-helix transcriptional regulator [Enterobacter sp. Ap-867]NIG28552.1 helix-turn-helix transcriptional regulator [Enterobacter sp. Ap-916]
METGKRIRQLRKAKNMTILELATSVGSDVGNISRLERGVQGFTEQLLVKISAALGVKVADLFTEEELDIEPVDKTVNTAVKSYVVVVLDAKASAGNGVTVFNEVDETISSIIYENDKAMEIFGHRPAESMRVITVIGDSMSGTIETGDNIFVDISKDYFDGDGIYVFKFKGSLMVKRLQFTADGLLVRSDNPKYADWLIREENEQYLKVLGRVIYTHSVTRYV